MPALSEEWYLLVYGSEHPDVFTFWLTVLVLPLVSHEEAPF